MRLLDEAAEIAGVAQRWKDQYFIGGKWGGTGRKNEWEIYQRLFALRATATAADVAAIIGNDSWIGAHCTECGNRGAIVLVGDEPGYDSSTVYLCRDCVSKLFVFVQPVAEAAPLKAPQPEESFLHPIQQVWFRAGLLACREYMARFVAAESPIIAASIRANWWPALGPDFGPPRKLTFAEVTRGTFGETDFRAATADELTPTQEALPIALGFLQQPDPPVAGTRLEPPAPTPDKEPTP